LRVNSMVLPCHTVYPCWAANIQSGQQQKTEECVCKREREMTLPRAGRRPTTSRRIMTAGGTPSGPVGACSL
jgi:hypothetical protein